MKYFYLIPILYIGLITACNSTDILFPKEDILLPELMPLQGITSPIRVEVKHPFLILQNWQQRDSVFHIYDLTNYELKSAFGTEGQGPKEYVLPWLVQTTLPDFLIADNQSFHYFGINKEGQPIFKGAKEVKYVNSVNEAVFINDSLFVVDAQYTGPNIYLLTLQEKLPKKTWKYRNSDIVDYITDPNMGKIYANESRIVFCYGYKKQIDFMDTEFNLIKRVKFKFDSSPDSNLGGENDKISYTYGYLGKRYLYTLFFGTSWKEYRANSTYGNILEVFDLDGNPVARYHLEGRGPVYFAVDEETFTLYGAGEDGDPEDNLLVYKLKGLS